MSERKRKVPIYSAICPHAYKSVRCSTRLAEADIGLSHTDACKRDDKSNYNYFVILGAFVSLSKWRNCRILKSARPLSASPIPLQSCQYNKW